MGNKHENRSPDGDGPSSSADPFARSREREHLTRMAAYCDGDMHIPEGSEPSDSHPAHQEPTDESA
jgi:hypothetical protein